MTKAVLLLQFPCMIIWIFVTQVPTTTKQEQLSQHVNFQGDLLLFFQYTSIQKNIKILDNKISFKKQKPPNNT